MGIFKRKRKAEKQTTKIEVAFPDPEKTNDFRFLKYVQREPVYKLEPTYEEIKRRSIYLKPKFEEAIKSKIKEGFYQNPLDFKEYFGTKFDLIGLQFLKGTDDLLSAFQLGVCFIQNEKIADSETYDFRPPEHIVESKRFQKTLEILDFEQEWLEDFSFQDVWESFEMRDYFNENTIAVWDEEADILESVLKYNRIKDYDLSIIRIKEIAQQNGLPDLIDELLKKLNSSLTINSDMSLIMASLAFDLKESGIEIDNYTQKISSANKKRLKSGKSNDLKKDFVAIDVETAIGKRWSICQIGLTIVENAEIKQTISQLVQPPNNEFASMNTKIHGITSEMTESEPYFPEIWNKVYPIIANNRLVAHNASFDIDCLRQTLDYYNLPIPEFEYDCTLNLIGGTLDSACDLYDIDLKNHHDAACDAEACAKLYLCALNNIEPKLTNRKSKKRVSNVSPDKWHESLKGDVLKPDLENADKNSPFYGKKVVFTGVLNSISRKVAAEITKKMGADIDTGITKRTNFVITGKDPGPSKMNKIIKYNNEGSEIVILYEKDFLKMIE